jgi:hypothetical protein
MKLKFKPHPKPGAAEHKIKPQPKYKDTPPKLKSQPGYVRCMFTLSHSSYSILQKCVRDKHLGASSYDAALQLILQEWKLMKDQQHHPVLIAVPADMLPKQVKPKAEE